MIDYVGREMTFGLGSFGLDGWMGRRMWEMGGTNLARR